jgi:hypothetical protein
MKYVKVLLILCLMISFTRCCPILKKLSIIYDTKIEERSYWDNEFIDSRKQAFKKLEQKLCNAETINIIEYYNWTQGSYKCILYVDNDRIVLRKNYGSIDFTEFKIYNTERFIIKNLNSDDFNSIIEKSKEIGTTSGTRIIITKAVKSNKSWSVRTETCAAFNID